MNISKKCLLLMSLMFTGQFVLANDLAKCRNVTCENGDYSAQDLSSWTNDGLSDKYLNRSDFEDSVMPNELVGRTLKDCNFYGAKFGGKKATLSFSDVTGSFINDQTDFKDLHIRAVVGFNNAHYPRCERVLQANQFDIAGLSNDQIIANLVAGQHACNSKIAETQLYVKKMAPQPAKQVIFDPTKPKSDYASLADVINRCQWNFELASCGDVAHKFFKDRVNEPLALKSMIHPGTIKAYPIHLAIDANQPAAVQWLAANGANLNEPDENGLMPLHRATDHSIAAVHALLACSGVDVNKPFLSFSGLITPLVRAVTERQVGVVAALAKAPNIKIDAALELAIKKENYSNAMFSIVSQKQRDQIAQIRQILTQAKLADNRAKASKYSLCRATGWFCK